MADSLYQTAINEHNCPSCGALAGDKCNVPIGLCGDRIVQCLNSNNILRFQEELFTVSSSK